MATVTERNAEVVDYEHVRNARIEENKKRMQELGLLNLAKQVSETRKKRPRSQAQSVPPRGSIPLPPRRSSRLQNATPVSYAELPKWNETSETTYNTEIYTEEHEKLLGSCESEWVLFQDGYGPDGNRIYDSVKGKTCHQCRQKTLGLRTHCSTCNLVQGQFCGDCLFMRYGENVLEVNKNPEWMCSVCRGICNCSLCRVKKGWAPTGYLYRKVTNEGFKSVAHYLILTRCSSTQSESTDTISSSCRIEDNKDDTSLNGAKRSLKFASLPNVLSGKGEEKNSFSNSECSERGESDSLPRLTEEPNICDIKRHHSDEKIVSIAASQTDCGDGEIILNEEPEKNENQRESSKAVTQNCYGDVEIISVEEPEQDKNLRESSKIASSQNDAEIILNEEPEKDKIQKESSKEATQNGYGDVDIFSTEKAASQDDYGDVETISTEKPKPDKNQIETSKAATENDWGDVEIISVQESKQEKNQRKPSRRNTYPQGGIAERLRARTARKPSS
ncbi:hypothetical protein SUGI_0579310 [Cryptomeria japonica]|nr:hypothetical protein SUGI_0579310 [Cryptomeria japonica]